MLKNLKEFCCKEVNEMSVVSSTKMKSPLVGTILTVSDTRTVENDHGGGKIYELLVENQHIIAHRIICADSITEIQEKLATWISSDEIDFIITTGGTGIAKRDVTIEAVAPLLEKEIVGFGECFRWLSFTEDVGTRAIASRALAGTVNDKVLFALPGSVKAVQLAMNRLILPELKHLVFEATKHKK
jgi:molybdenum cofactor biosynthesis protein B